MKALHFEDRLQLTRWLQEQSREKCAELRFPGDLERNCRVLFEQGLAVEDVESGQRFGARQVEETPAADPLDSDCLFERQPLQRGGLLSRLQSRILVLPYEKSELTALATEVLDRVGNAGDTELVSLRSPRIAEDDSSEENLIGLAFLIQPSGRRGLPGNLAFRGARVLRELNRGWGSFIPVECRHGLSSLETRLRTSTARDELLIWRRAHEVAERAEIVSRQPLVLVASLRQLMPSSIERSLNPEAFTRFEVPIQFVRRMQGAPKDRVVERIFRFEQRSYHRAEGPVQPLPSGLLDVMDLAQAGVEQLQYCAVPIDREGRRHLGARHFVRTRSDEEQLGSIGADCVYELSRTLERFHLPIFVRRGHRFRPDLSALLRNSLHSNTIADRVRDAFGIDASTSAILVDPSRDPNRPQYFELKEFDDLGSVVDMVFETWSPVPLQIAKLIESDFVQSRSDIVDDAAASYEATHSQLEDLSRRHFEALGQLSTETQGTLDRVTAQLQSVQKIESIIEPLREEIGEGWTHFVEAFIEIHSRLLMEHRKWLGEQARPIDEYREVCEGVESQRIPLVDTIYESLRDLAAQRSAIAKLEGEIERLVSKSAKDIEEARAEEQKALEQAEAAHRVLNEKVDGYRPERQRVQGELQRLETELQRLTDEVLEFEREKDQEDQLKSSHERRTEELRAAKQALLEKQKQARAAITQKALEEKQVADEGEEVQKLHLQVREAEERVRALQPKAKAIRLETAKTKTALEKLRDRERAVDQSENRLRVMAKEVRQNEQRIVVKLERVVESVEGDLEGEGSLRHLERVRMQVEQLKQGSGRFDSRERRRREQQLTRAYERYFQEQGSKLRRLMRRLFWWRGVS